MAKLSDVEKAVNQRLKTLYDHLTVSNIVDSVTDFCEKSGLDRSNFSKYWREDEHQKEVKTEVVVKLTQSFGVSPNWLLTGEGEMFKQSGSTTSTAPAHTGLQILPVTVDDYGQENIVLVNTKAQAGYPTMLQEPEFYRSLPVIKIPDEAYRNGTFRAFEVNKDSMSPTLHHGAIVIGRYEDNWEKGNIKEGYIYVVVTTEHVVVKRVLNRLDRGELYLMSDNEEYEGYPEQSENVLQLWRVVGGLVNKFPNTRYEWRRKMSHMEADMYELKQEIVQIRRLLP